jgi:hypothetical protein
MSTFPFSTHTNPPHLSSDLISESPSFFLRLYRNCSSPSFTPELPISCTSHRTVICLSPLCILLVLPVTIGFARSRSALLSILLHLSLRSSLPVFPSIDHLISPLVRSHCSHLTVRQGAKPLNRPAEHDIFARSLKQIPPSHPPLTP